jgi:hypothetical protein
MDFRFYLINERTGTQTEIEEPVGFDNFKPILRRGEMHGVDFEFAEQTLGFYGNAYRLVTEEYSINGVDGVLVFLVEYHCGGAWQEFYRGSLDYVRYEEVRGEHCIVNVGVAQLGVPMTLKNRMDAKVYLNTTSGFDGAVLPKYINLGREIMIPGRGILVENVAKMDSEDSFSYVQSGGGTGYNIINHLYTIPFGVSELDQIKTFSPQNGIVYNGDAPLLSSTDFDYGKAGETALFINDTGSEIRIDKFSFQLRLSVSSAATNTNPNLSHTFSIRLVAGVFNTNNEFLGIVFSRNLTGGQVTDVEYDGGNTSLGLYPGYKVAVFLSVINIFVGYALDDNDVWINEYSNIGFTIVVEGGYNRVSMNYLSRVAPSLSKVYLLHESLSRITEAITNGALTVRSNYYGRTDSEVNPTQSDGAGSLRCITNGYFLRRAVLTDGSEPFLYLSFKDLCDGLNALDAIGYGIEGSHLRMEPWRYFYREEVVFRCSDIHDLSRTLDSSRCFSLFNIGYDKWESETWHSIDGFHGKRQYRTRLKSVDTKLEHFCKLIADGYAIEATRRVGIEETAEKGRESTKDWQYDNNTFIIDLVRGVWPTSMNVNTGGGDGHTLIDPTTVVNVELSPARMAARWFSWVMQALTFSAYIVPESCIQCGACYDFFPGIFKEGALSALFLDGTLRFPLSDNYLPAILHAIEICLPGAIGIDASDLIFTSAEGYSGAITTSQKQDSGITGEVSEQQDLDVSIIRSSVSLLKPELVEFEYPLTVAEFMHIRDNRYGLVEFDGEYGWIKEIEADLLGGMAKFLLIPKR